jgi:hypothetical protein
VINVFQSFSSLHRQPQYVVHESISQEPFELEQSCVPLSNRQNSKVLNGKLNGFAAAEVIWQGEDGLMQNLLTKM